MLQQLIGHPTNPNITIIKMYLRILIVPSNLLKTHFFLSSSPGELQSLGLQQVLPERRASLV